MGDVNGDGNVNIADAIGVVNYVLKNEMTTFVAEAADMNGDGSINIADAIAIVNQILKM
jgi:membrane-bound lytic murein transglycosylase B